MLPIMISEGVSGSLIIKVLGIKILLGVIFGFLIDLLLINFKKTEEANKIETICEHDHCHCEEGIWKSAIKHTISIFIFIFIVSLILNTIIYFIGEENLKQIVSNKPILGSLIAGLIGLIPNCASSVILTELYISDVINLGIAVGGLSINAGLGLLVLFKTNHNIKENIAILSILYTIGVVSGILLQFLNIF